MANPFVGEIIMFAGNFAPRSYAFCDGQLLAISSNQALFSLLGTVFGGDGRTTFGLPDLRGRVPIHQGEGPGLSNRRLGQKSGAETVTIDQNTTPTHNHTFSDTNDAGQRTDPTDSFPAQSGGDIYKMGNAVRTNMNSNSLLASGNSQSHMNIMPFQCINFCIALFGVYPSRN